VEVVNIAACFSFPIVKVVAGVKLLDERIMMDPTVIIVMSILMSTCRSIIIVVLFDSRDFSFCYTCFKVLRLPASGGLLGLLFVSYWLLVVWRQAALLYCDDDDDDDDDDQKIEVR
jgi:hypothetical protein